MTQRNYSQPSNETYRAIRRVLHPDTYIGRCILCNKAWRFHLEEPQICRTCMDGTQ